MSGQVVLISTYELGRQPFGLAAPAAMLRAAGATVELQDLSVAPLDESTIDEAALVAIHVPMHTATRLAQGLLPRIRELAPGAHLCVYGLYAPLNEAHLRRLGAQTVLGGECESRLVELYELVRSGALDGNTPQSLPVLGLEHQHLETPDRTGLPSLDNYAQLVLADGEHRLVGYTEATRGCAHRCRHCPVVPIYDGRFRAVTTDVVLGDIERQVAAGAQHITFGDPDFFNGPAHALRVARALHSAHPELTYDVTIKVQHLRQHIELLEELRATGCILITSAVESFDPAILDRFEKHHTSSDIIAVVEELRRIDLAFNPTFVAFTPWTTLRGYRHFLHQIAELGLVGNVAPIQYAIRLLITEGSRLLELPDVAELVDGFDDEALCYQWRHPDPAVDDLQSTVMAIVSDADGADTGRHHVFAEVCDAAGALARDRSPGDDVEQLATIPYMTEPWYC